MVATAEGLALTQAHDLAQANTLAKALQASTAAFGLLNPADLDGTFPAYALLAEHLLARFREDSARVAAGYYETLRQVEGVRSPAPVVPLPAPLPTEQAATSLLVTGPVAIKAKLAKGALLDDAVSAALQMTLGAIGRHVQNGGRDYLRSAIMRDPEARGYARRSAGSPCSFCAMLIGRGPVYKSQATADFRSHDHCHCAVAPFFRGSGWTSQAADYASLYESAITTEDGRRLSGDKARSAFRQALASRTAAEAPSAVATAAHDLSRYDLTA